MNTNTLTIQEPTSNVVAATNDQATPGTLDSILVSYANNIKVSQSSPKTLAWVVEQIKGSDILREQITRIRACQSTSERQALKEATIPWFSFATFKDGYRSNSTFLSTKFVVIDCDHLGDSLSSCRESFGKDPDVFVCFLSPSGDGLKVVFELQEPVTRDEDYRRVFNHFRQLVTTKHSVTPDPHADPARTCYLSFDASIHINPARRVRAILDATHVVEEQEEPLQYESKILLALAGSSAGERTHNATKIIGHCIRKGLPEAVTTEFLRLWNQARNTPPLDEPKITSTVRYMYKHYGDTRLLSTLESYYSYRTEILDVGIVGDEFFLEDIGTRKFLIRTKADDKETQDRYLEHVVRQKHIRHLLRIDHLGDASVARSFVEYVEEEGLFRVHYAPIAAHTQDNLFIDSWLKDTFGPHAEFIKQWLAVYCYSNYRKLPTLVLKGDRGTGKNTFAESVLSIFPSISQFWHGEEKNFTPEVQKKLLIADESVSANEKQYRMLKQRSGQKMSVVNQKFLPEYQVRNNMNIIILSNEHTPIFVQKDEEPTSEKNNQFFVYTMPKLKGEIDPDFGVKVEDRLGHYVRTELKAAYEAVKNIPGCRYSIPTPITDEEKALFNVNQTGIEEEGMKFLRKMVERNDEAYVKFFEAGLFPSSFVDSYSISKGYTKNGVIRNLKEKGYLKPADPERKMVKGERQYCFEMTEELKKWYQEQKVAQ
jgi:hypothetical protein